MKSKYIIYFIVLIIVIAIVYYFYQRQKEQKKQDLKKQEEEREKESELEMEKELQKREDLKEKEKIELKRRALMQKKLEMQKMRQEKEKKKPKEDLVYMDIGINDQKLGRIIIKLFSDVVPKTCHNFRTLCNNNKKLSYKNAPFHRIIKDFMLQGGDFTNENGTGGMSIYGNKFEDENFDIPHDQPYLLSMANSGPNTNGSQFFITTSETPHLDGKHVVFGIVVKGHEVVDQLNEIETGGNDRPVDDVRILDCGVI
jgi:cyclophilin family peptidyl-prolyl cis-trans isomerase